MEMDVARGERFWPLLWWAQLLESLRLSCICEVMHTRMEAGVLMMAGRILGKSLGLVWCDIVELLSETLAIPFHFLLYETVRV